MWRAVSISFAAVSVMSLAWHSSRGSNGEIEKLKEQRVAVLKEHVNQLESLFKLGRVSVVDKLGPANNLLNVQIEYARNENQKRELLEQLLRNYETLIQSSEESVRSGKGGLEALSSMYEIKSERLRVKIAIAELGE